MASIEKKNEMLRLGKYLTSHLENMFEQNGFQTLHSSEETCNITVKRREHMKELKNMGFRYDGTENIFLSAYGHNESWNSDNLKKGMIQLITSMDVLVTQKQ